VTYVWHAAPVQSLEELKSKELIVGAQAPGSTQYDFPILLNHLFGTKFKDVSSLQPMLSVRMAQGVPLEAIDLCACTVTDDAIRLLGEIVHDVQEIDDGDWREIGWPTLTKWSRDIARFLNGDSNDSDEDEEDYFDDMYSDGDIDDEDEEEGLDELQGVLISTQVRNI